jgi:hypothetical protein
MTADPVRAAALQLFLAEPRGGSAEATVRREKTETHSVSRKLGYGLASEKAAQIVIRCQGLTLAFAPRSSAKRRSADGNLSFMASIKLPGSLAFLSSSSKTSK